MTRKQIIIILSLGVFGFIAAISAASLSALINSAKQNKENLTILQVTFPPSPTPEIQKLPAREIKLNRLKINRPKPGSSVLPIIQEETVIPSPSDDGLEWGVAKQIGEHTWTMKINQDDRMTNANELFEALNNYRQSKGVNKLQYDARLSQYAQSRTDYFVTLGKTDEHTGFNEFLKTEENFQKLGFASLGENSSWGYQMTGVHLIEWIYAADSSHDNNQLDPDWTQVGIGINGTATDLIFGGNAL